ncbi:MAG: glycine--tRNA ligase subunit beta [Chloroflexota bacterium]|nr:glycine--tRNA ligase subunit beta [Chloroflexota bacterium]
MSQKPLTFQQVILRLQDYWEAYGCLIWQPYSEKVGAGTMNPATVLRVLGPEPWNVAYVEPSYRPDDGRFGDNPNRMQMHTQFQVILKPDPGNPQEIYLESLYALGIRREEHDIRFVEDNWKSPVLGAWGLGWEVWLDGLEITQYTYFQQAGGLSLDPISVELTYGLERIVMYLQDVRSVWDIDWDGKHTYGEIYLPQEVEHCEYAFNLADVEALTKMYDLYEAEARHCLDSNLVIPAHDYVLRCSHTFNLLDTRGAIGVTERATYFRRMRSLSGEVAEAYVEQRQRLEYPWLEDEDGGEARGERKGVPQEEPGIPHDSPTTFLLEIGTEELPAGDLDDALDQLRQMAPDALQEARLEYDDVRILGTPRRLVVLAGGLAPRQRAVEKLVKGPPAQVAFDAGGRPTRAGEGFARSQGVDLSELEIKEMDGGEYTVAVRREEGRPAAAVLPDVMTDLLSGLRFRQSMRWNETGVTFSRPIRWLVGLLGDTVVPCDYAGVASGRTSRGPRCAGSPAFEIPSAGMYPALLDRQGIMADPDERRAFIVKRARELAESVGGHIPEDRELLSEVTHLVEQPNPFVGSFEEQYLSLPTEVLVAVMKKHQRTFPVLGQEGEMLPYFVAVRNGGNEHLDIVRHGNEEVIRARFADAEYFYEEDTKQPLEDFLPRLDTLIFQEELGSVLDKTHRLETLVPELAPMVDLTPEETELAVRTAHLCKADLATQMVVEHTSLQGVMGREYALKSGERPEVAQAIYEHYLPRSAGDEMPESKIGLTVGLADRLDSLAGLFAIGLIPTGSADPYGLRRDALGLVQSLLAHRLSFSIERGLQEAGELLPVEARDEALAEALEFVVERLRGTLRDAGYRYDVVDAVLAERGDDPHRAREGVEDLSRWVERDDWGRILDNYSRCVRITRDFDEQFDLDPALFEEPAEEELHDAYQEARLEVTPDGSVDELLTAFVPLVEVIDRYFARESGVLVMAEDEAVRRNRLGQLQHIAALASGIVDLSRLEGF